MIRSEARSVAKRKRVDHRKTQFAHASFKEQDYPYRLSFYDVPPTQEISLEDFETWAIDRLRSNILCSSPQSYINHLQFWPRLRPARFETNPLKKPPPTSNPYSRNTSHSHRIPPLQAASSMNA